MHNKLKAIELRKRGNSYSDISKILGVSKSTLSLWLRNIDFIPNKKVRNRIFASHNNLIRMKIDQKEKTIEKAKKEAQKNLRNVNKRDLFMLGLGIYLGEGSKSQNIIRIVNSDPNIINLMIVWFEKICNLDKNNFRLAIHLYPDNNIQTSINFWSDITKIPKRQFGKTQIDNRVKKGEKSKKLPYGTAHLTIVSLGDRNKGVFLRRKIDFWMEMIKEKLTRV